MILAREPAAADAPPACQGGEGLRFDLEISVDGGSTWSSSPWVTGQPGQSIYVMLRTVMTVDSGQTQGWSLGVEHDPSWLQYYSGDIYVSSVSTDGTDTETVQNGAPPDTEETAIRYGYDGFTQGVVIDNSMVISLDPTSGFITSTACYWLTFPAYTGYHSVPFTLTNDVGSPPIRTVITQEGESLIPCAGNVTLTVYVDYYSSSPGGCNGWGSAPMSAGPSPGTVMAAGAEGGAGPEATVDFLRGDANDDGNVNISDAMFGLSYLFQAGTPPGCRDALDANDDEELDVSDPIYMLIFLFVGGGRAPGWPYPCCGQDLTGDGTLGCDVFTSCTAGGPDGDNDGLTNACEALLGTDPGKKDTDKDSFEDGEEVLPTGVDGLDLARLGANPLKPDVFVEIDWFVLAIPGEPLNHDHEPFPPALDAVVAAFQNAPTPITLHIDAGAAGLFNLGIPLQEAGGNAIVFDENVEFLDELYLVVQAGNCTCKETFDRFFALKAANFDEAKRGNVFHYSLWCHFLNELDPNAGIAPGVKDENFIVALNESHQTLDVSGDGFADETDRILIEGGTFMHELGHNFGLRHGGDKDPCSSATKHHCKPNYLSVMNYRYSMRGVDSDHDFCPDGVLDYSREKLPPQPAGGLNENQLDESKGIDGATWIDWDGDGELTPGTVSRDVNHDEDLYNQPAPAEVTICGQDRENEPGQTRICDARLDDLLLCGKDGETNNGLTGFDDWAAILSPTNNSGLGGPKLRANKHPSPNCGGGSGCVAEPGTEACPVLPSQ